MHQVAREGPLTAGLQLKAPHLEDLLRKHPREAQSVSSFAFAYSPAGTAIGAQATCADLPNRFPVVRKHSLSCKCMVHERPECGVWADVVQAKGSSQQP